jgi:hypothetical protein
VGGEIVSNNFERLRTVSNGLRPFQTDADGEFGAARCGLERFRTADAAPDPGLPCTGPRGGASGTAIFS